MGTIDDTYEDTMDKVFELTVINANARSLCPKIESFITCMEETESSIAIVTEMWFRDSPELASDLADLKGKAGISMLTLNREPNALGVSHGGVAIAYNQNKCTVTEIKLTNVAGWEVLAAVARFVGFHRPVVVVACYVCLLYTSPSPRDLSTSRMPSSA